MVFFFLVFNRKLLKRKTQGEVERTWVIDDTGQTFLPDIYRESKARIQLQSLFAIYIFGNLCIWYTHNE